MRSIPNYPAICVLFLSSLFSGISWFNIASIFPFIASDLGIGIAQLGLMSATFLAGVGLGQVPAGIISAKIGLKRTIVLGTIVSSFAILLSATVYDPIYLIVLRFLVGIAAAFISTPGIILSARYFATGREGFAVGLYDASSLIGGVVGLVGNAIIATSLGWRVALATNGVAGLFLVVALLFAIPKENVRIDFKMRASSVRKVLLDRWLVTLGLALLGLEITVALVGNFMVVYLNSGQGKNVVTSGVSTSLLPIFGILPTIAFGRFFDRAKDVRKLIIYLGLLTASGLAISAFSTLVSAILSTSLVGFFEGAGYILCVVAARHGNKHETEYEVLGVSWTLTLSLVGSFFAPIFFSYAVILNGYSFAWIASSLLSIGFFFPLVLTSVKH